MGTEEGAVPVGKPKQAVSNWVPVMLNAVTVAAVYGKFITCSESNSVFIMTVCNFRRCFLVKYTRHRYHEPGRRSQHPSLSEPLFVRLLKVKAGKTCYDNGR